MQRDEHEVTPTHNENCHRNNGRNRFGFECVCLHFGHNTGQKAEAVNTFFTPTPPDPLDVARDHAVDQKIEEAHMKDRQLRAYLEAAISGKRHEEQCERAMKVLKFLVEHGGMNTDEVSIRVSMSYNYQQKDRLMAVIEECEKEMAKKETAQPGGQAVSTL